MGLDASRMGGCCPFSQSLGEIAHYAGGLSTGVLLFVCLLFAIRFYRRTGNVFWLWIGALFALGSSLESLAGVLEGGFNHLYNPTGFGIIGSPVGLLTALLYGRFARHETNTTTWWIARLLSSTLNQPFWDRPHRLGTKGPLGAKPLLRKEGNQNP